MKRLTSIIPIALLIAFASMCNGCEADVDLNNIDKDVQVDANLALPIGMTKLTLGDFLGDGSYGIYVDSINNKGVLMFKDTFSIAKNFHKVELSSYVSKASLKMNMYDKVGGTIVGTGVTTPIEFPLTLKLSGINHDEDHQRLDSVLVKNASFVSRISQLGGLPLEWDWIERVTITMGEAFHREQGNVIDVYTKGDGYGYDQDIEMNIDEFSMNLMKNKHLNPNIDQEKYGQDNVVDSCTFLVTMYVNVPAEAGVVTVPSTAAFQYDLNVRFIDYHALWGMFRASSDMSDEREVSLTNELGVWKMFESATLPFSDPKIDMKITTHIAGALVLDSAYVYVREEGGENVYATFDGAKTYRKAFSSNEYLGLNTSIGDSATMHILLDKDPARGHLDQLFTVKPDHFAYKFSVDFDRFQTPQIRVTDNTNIHVDAECELPMIFNEGVSVVFSDTIENIDLSALSLDSLLQEVPGLVDTIEDATLTLAMQVVNSIPLQLKLTAVCLDQADQVVMVPGTGEPLKLIANDTLLVPAPEHQFVASTSTWNVTPDTITNVIQLDKDKVDVLPQIKKVVLRAALDDESLAAAYDQGLTNIKLTKYQGLDVKLGVGATVDAVLDLDALIEQ